MKTQDIQGMTGDRLVLMNAGIAFIDEMTASAMHELKNKLAIINENSGLIQDLAWMAKKKDQPLDIDRMEVISGKIQKHVHMSDVIIKMVNRFSSGMDNTETESDLSDVTAFVLLLAGRLIQKRECRVQLVPPEAPVKVRARLFALKNLVWLILKSVCNSVEPGSLIEVIPQLGQDGKPALIVRSENGNRLVEKVSLESEDIKTLMNVLGAQLELDGDSKTVRIVFQSSNNCRN